jgi:hypothetical protein
LNFFVREQRSDDQTETDGRTVVGDRDGLGGLKDGGSDSDWVRVENDAAEELFTEDPYFADWVMVAPASELFAYDKVVVGGEVHSTGIDITRRGGGIDSRRRHGCISASWLGSDVGGGGVLSPGGLAFSP